MFEPKVRQTKVKRPQRPLGSRHTAQGSDEGGTTEPTLRVNGYLGTERCHLALHPIYGKTWEGVGWDCLWDAIFYFIAKDVVNTVVTISVVVFDV